VLLEPVLVLLVRVEVVQDDVKFAAWDCRESCVRS
jgi:hypothetical protein